MLNKDQIIGQLFFRCSGGIYPGARRIMMVVGIFNLPADCPIQDEHQYVLVGSCDPWPWLNLVPQASRDLTAIARGDGLDGLIRQAVWSVPLDGTPLDKSFHLKGETK